MELEKSWSLTTLVIKNALLLIYNSASNSFITGFLLLYFLKYLLFCFPKLTGATGRAFLFNRVVNLRYSEVQDRVMLTGRHMVRDVSCKNCNAKLGWIYEFATEDNQRYKEGRVILERALVSEVEGMNEQVVQDSWSHIFILPTWQLFLPI